MGGAWIWIAQWANIRLEVEQTYKIGQKQKAYDLRQRVRWHV